MTKTHWYFFFFHTDPRHFPAQTNQDRIKKSKLRADCGSKGHCWHRETIISIENTKMSIFVHMFFLPNIVSGDDFHSQGTSLNVTMKMDDNLFNKYKEDSMNCWLKIRAKARDRNTGRALGSIEEYCEINFDKASFIRDFISNDALESCNSQYVEVTTELEFITDLKEKFNFTESEDGEDDFLWVHKKINTQ